MSAAVQKAAELIRNSAKTIALTGAGVSTESGIPDFRSAKGLWARYDPVEYGTINAFLADPEKIWQMLFELIEFVHAQPNHGHILMAELEKNGWLAGIITQNIDTLHQKAGSAYVVEFHGSIASLSCPACGNSVALESLLPMKTTAPRCQRCRSFMKPDIVFFDEQIPPPALLMSQELIRQAQVMIVAGTSCQTYPAARLPLQIKENGGSIIEINRKPSLAGVSDIVLQGGFSEMMESLCRELMGSTLRRRKHDVSSCGE